MDEARIDELPTVIGAYRALIAHPREVLATTAAVTAHSTDVFSNADEILKN